MATYIILRHGSNSANQGMQQEMILGTIEATSYKSVKIPSTDGWFHCYSNQRVEVISFTAYRQREGLSVADVAQLVFEAERGEEESAQFQQDMERLHG